MASLSNSSDVYADKLYLSLGEVGVVDLAETVAAKAETTETYTISVLDMILDDKIDDTEFSAAVGALGSVVSLKANIADVYTKTEVNASTLSTTSSLNLKADKSTTYTKNEVDATFANLVNSAPEGLNQLSELANALANDANYATTIQNQLALKAPLANPTFTGTTTLGTVNQILFDTTFGAPTLTASAGGNKLILYPSLSASLLDYAIGVETADMFFSTENSSAGYKFYGGTAVATTISGTGNIDTIGSMSSASSSTTGNATVGGNLTVSGNLSVLGTTSFANPYWVAVVINFTGGIPTIVRNGGRNAATSLVRVSGQATGIIQFDFPAHPQGTTYIVSASASAGYATIATSVRTSSRVGITMRNTANALFDTETHVLVLAY